MKYLVYSDLQATDGSELCHLQPTVTLQHYRVTKFFDDIAKIYSDHACDGVVDLGDTTDDRSSIPLTTIEILGAGLAKIPEGNHVKITGNHDQFLRNGSISNKRLFDHKFTVIENRKIFTVGSKSVFYVSYPADYAELAAWLDHRVKTIRGPKLLFGHFEVEGALYHNSIALKGIPPKLLESFELVMLGHIHLPQSVTSKIHYIGSPFQQDWGEAGQLKRVAIVDTETAKVKWIPLEGYPEYQTITFEHLLQLPVDPDENRYKVILKTHAEAEQFFQHPAFNKAVAQYDYTEATEEKDEDNEESKDWSFSGLCRQYLKTVPPNKVGIELTDDEMIEMTDMVVNL